METYPKKTPLEQAVEIMDGLFKYIQHEYLIGLLINRERKRNGTDTDKGRVGRARAGSS